MNQKFQSGLCCLIDTDVVCQNCDVVICCNCWEQIARKVERRDIIPSQDVCAVEGKIDNVGYHWWIAVADKK